jgi:hypothetical protein
MFCRRDFHGKGNEQRHVSSSSELGGWTHFIRTCFQKQGDGEFLVLCLDSLVLQMADSYEFCMAQSSRSAFCIRLKSLT